MRYIVALNFSDADRVLTIPFSDNGEWIDLLSGDVLHVTGFASSNYMLTRHWGAIFRKVG